MDYDPQEIEREVKNTLSVLKDGGVILYPTDTVWGLGCDATNEKAVQKIFKIKQREESKSLVTLVDNEPKLMRYVPRVPDISWDIIDHSIKPVTIIYPNARGLAPNVISEDGSVAIRIPKDEFCRELIRQFGNAIVSTSANISGEPTPANFSEVSQAILDAVDYVVNLRHSETGKAQPSSIIKLGMKGEVEIIRK